MRYLRCAKITLSIKDRDLWARVCLHKNNLNNIFKVKHHEIQLETVNNATTSRETHWTLGHLLGWIRDNLLTPDRPELFLKDKHEKDASRLDVRPGILVLVNDADWELVGQTEYTLEDGDNVTFISTLHGG